MNCKIDKVDGIIETERSDERNKLYKQVLKKGDHLLNRIQKLSRVIDVWYPLDRIRFKYKIILYKYLW